MKKLLCLLFIGTFIMAISCTKTCDCKEKNTGQHLPKVTIKSGAHKAFSTCKQYQDALNANSDANWTCK